jgi:hypothetical protein
MSSSISYFYPKTPQIENKNHVLNWFIFIYICQMVRFYLATPIPLQTWRLQNSIILKFFLYRLQQLKSEYFLLMWCWFKKNVCFCFLYSNFYEYSHFFNNLKFMFNKLLYVGDVLHGRKTYFPILRQNL